MRPATTVSHELSQTGGNSSHVQRFTFQRNRERNVRDMDAQMCIFTDLSECLCV